MIRQLLTAMKDNLIYVVLGSLFIGLAFGQIAGTETKSVLRAAVVPVLFVMIYPMMINIDLREIVNIRHHATVIAVSLLINFGIAPILAVGLSRLFFAGQIEYTIGLYFIALIPTSGMTAAWTGLADGDLEAALVAMSVNLLAAVGVLPLYLSALIPGNVGFDPSALYQQLAFIVVVPMVAGVLTRSGLLRQYGTSGFKRLKPIFGGISSLGVMLIVFIAMAMRSQSILADPLASMSTVIPLIIFYAVILAVGALLGQAVLDDARGVSLVYATSMRNLSIAVAVVAAPGFPPAEAVLPIALAYVIQPPLGAVYMHYRRDIRQDDSSIREAVTRLV
jgi:ACR3 family arsenite efflux pump ArsB